MGKQSLVIIGTILFITVTSWIVFKYHRYNHLSLRGDQIADYERFNDQLMKSHIPNTFVDAASVIEDDGLKEQFRHLLSESKLIFLDRSYGDLVVYKIKHEKVKPVFGIGLNYFSHYLIYSKDVADFNRYFKDSSSEEEFVTSDQLKENWYYVVGEHYSD